MLNGDFEKLLNKNVSVKSIYPFSFDEINKFKKVLISLKILFFKNPIYKKYVKNNYDVEVAFLEGPITTILSSKNEKAKKIAWIHTDISLPFENNLKFNLKKFLNKHLYKKYNKLVFVSDHNLDKFNRIYNINVPKMVIHNYLNTKNVLSKSKEFNPNYPKDNIINFVTVSRLVEQKAMDRLITVHHKLITEGYNHRFYVVGTGPLKSYLENLINKLNVSNTFFLLGQKGNPYPYILNADYFCLLSYSEGLPMTLLEAKALKKYIIITDTASKEALENYNNKKIAENSETGIYNALKDIIKNHDSLQISTNITNDENNEIIKKIINILGE
jgi:glycosyltransferase involved in cell wall biosynthesis